MSLGRSKVIFFVKFTHRTVVQLFLELVVEASAPNAKNGGTVEVEGGRKLDETIGFVADRLHEDDLVGEAQVDDKS